MAVNPEMVRVVHVVPHQPLCGRHHVEVDRSTSDDGTQLYSLRPLPENKFRSLEDLRQHYKRAREPRLPNRLTATVDPAGSESAV